ncbi:indole-3-glycerol phosphate synthase TrpC [Pelagibacteraceae bacterium]|nr:indole-3-glycerol phosphate synthase TrpC [Pelagibacteraceae bacterium]
MENILEKIIKQKKTDLKIIKEKISLTEIENKIKSINNFMDFKKKIIDNQEQAKVSLVAEIKKASPSAGIIIEDFDHLKIANLYADNNVACLSVLTEEKFFLGNLSYISDIKKKLKLPILAKDFFIDPYQVSYSKSFGCDCILIILSALSEKQADEIYIEALRNKLSIIVEVHNEEEAELSLKYNQAIIGINNRNLKTLDISLDNSINIKKKLTSHKGPFVSESGIRNQKDAQYIYDKTGIKNFLIGESLLASGEPGKLIKGILSINL